VVSMTLASVVFDAALPIRGVASAASEAGADAASEAAVEEAEEMEMGLDEPSTPAQGSTYAPIMAHTAHDHGGKLAPAVGGRHHRALVGGLTEPSSEADMGSIAELADVGSVASDGTLRAVEHEAADVVSMTLASVVFDDALPMRAMNGNEAMESGMGRGITSRMERGAPAHATHYPESEAGAEAASEAAVEEAEEMEMRIDEPLHQAGNRHGSIASGASKASSEGGRADNGSIAGLTDVGSAVGSAVEIEAEESSDVVSMTLASVVFTDTLPARHSSATGGAAYAASEAGADAASEAAVEEAEEMEMRIDEPVFDDREAPRTHS